MSKKCKKVSTILNYIENILLFSTSTGCVLNFALASLTGIPIGIPSLAVGLNNGAITAVIRRYKSIIKKKRKR